MIPHFLPDIKHVDRPCRFPLVSVWLKGHLDPTLPGGVS